MADYATDGKCHNAEPGTFNHECGKPALYIGTKENGFRSGFCARCYAWGFEAKACVSWEPAPNVYVTDTSDSSRYYRSVYRVLSTSNNRTLVRRVGHILPGGRLDCSGDRGETYRTTKHLEPWH